MLIPLIHAWRSWNTARGAGLLTIAAIAVGIGSATAIVSIVQAVLLTPLPWANPNRYEYVFGGWRARPGWYTTTSYLDYLDYTKQLRTVDAYGCSATNGGNITFNNQPQHVTATEVTASLVRALGVEPALGQ